EVAKRVLTYFAKNYPVFPLKTIVYFYNDSVFVAPGWGASKQISETLSGSDALRVFYNNPKIDVFYQDTNGNKIGDQIQIRLGTKNFLGY
ncbi:MAG: hypothetical protein Q8Q24_00300, partial [bacterium]|nr:hypothetical protein [bacterium]